MKNTVLSREREKLLKVLDGAWGTIGPEFLAANEELAAFAGCKKALCVFSASAALETVLRAHNIGRGDEVIVAAWSDPVDSMTCAAVGAVPVFADVDEKTLTLPVSSVETALTERTRVVIADLPGGNPCDAPALSHFCREHGLLFIINLSDCWGTEAGGRKIRKYADAAFADFGDGRLADAGLAGAVLTDDADAFEKYYAYHNCGRPQNAGASLSFDAILGGDLRIAEWQCSLIRSRISLIPERLSECRAESARVSEQISPVAVVPGGVSSRRGTLVAGEKIAGLRYEPCFELMSDAPLWNEEYYLKCTGAGETEPGSFPVSRFASENAFLAYPVEKE